MEKEPNKRHENGPEEMFHTGEPVLDDILHRLSAKREAGEKYMDATRKALMRMLKEYLESKFGRKVSFILPPDHPLGERMEDKGFYPSSVTVYDKYGFAACSSAVSVELTPEGKIVISTSESGNIYDAEEFLSNDDLLGLCHTITEYEQLLPEVRRELAENGEWEECARKLLAEHFPQAESGLREEFINTCWDNRQTENHNLQRFGRRQENNGK